MVERYPKTPQESAPVEVRRFSDKAREALAKEGYVIYSLTGKSIIDYIRESGRRLWFSGFEDSQDFKTKGSMHSEVAIKPDALFIPRSNNKTLKRQVDLIAKFSGELAKRVKGVEAVMGEAPDYVELAFVHLDVTDERLFGEKYDNSYARTKTPMFAYLVASVGRFDAVVGLSVCGWDRDEGYGKVFASPLVVPLRED